MGKTPDAVYDNPLKKALRLWPQFFIMMFFPTLYTKIDWDYLVEQLDTELQKIIGNAETGNQRVDKLYKVRLKSGKNAYILIHIEIQMILKADFLERLFVYNLSLFLAYRKDIITLGLVGDPTERQLETNYGYGFEEFTTQSNFGIAHTYDFLSRESMEKFKDNPFQFLVLAISRTQETNNESINRLNQKLLLTNELVHGHYPKEISHYLINMIDEMMSLPNDLIPIYEENVQNMSTIVEHEWIASWLRPTYDAALKEEKEKGFDAGFDEGGIKTLQDAILNKLTARHRTLPETLTSKIREIHSIEMLEELIEAAILSGSLEEFEVQRTTRTQQS